jgi:hypothetical protein
MIAKALQWLKCLLFGCEEKSEHLEWLEDKIEQADEKLEEIENEENTLDDNIDYLNK